MPFHTALVILALGRRASCEMCCVAGIAGAGPSPEMENDLVPVLVRARETSKFCRTGSPCEPAIERPNMMVLLSGVDGISRPWIDADPPPDPR